MVQKILIFNNDCRILADLNFICGLIAYKIESTRGKTFLGVVQYLCTSFYVSMDKHKFLVYYISRYSDCVQIYCKLFENLTRIDSCCIINYIIYQTRF